MTLPFSLNGKPKLGRKLLLIGLWLFALLLITNHFSLITRKAHAAPNPQPCQNAVATDKLTDNYITDVNGDPPEGFTFTKTGRGTPGSGIPLSQSLAFSVNFSQLQALFADTNSNYLEGSYQNSDHQSAPLLFINSENRNNYFGPIQKTSSHVMTDIIRVEYVKYVYGKPTLAESANTYTDVNGINPQTIYQMVQKWGLPQPGSAAWQGTWSKYWVKIPSAYSEFYEGKLEFRSAFGQGMVEKVKNGEFCPVGSPRTIKFIMPSFFRAAAVSGQLNTSLVPKVAQSPVNNLILASASGTKSVLGAIISKCVKLASQNPVSKALKKVVSFLETRNPLTPKPVLAQETQSCVKVVANGKPGAAPYCALPESELKPGDTCTNQEDSLKLDVENPNVVCTFQIQWSASLTIPSTGNGEWDSCTNNADGTRSCTATIAVWPNFRIPYQVEIWNNTTASDTTEAAYNQQTGRPGVYSVFTPKLVNSAMNPTPYQQALDMLNRCYPNWPDQTTADCSDLDEIGNIVPCAPNPDIKQVADCVSGKLGKVKPGEVSTVAGAKTSKVLAATNDNQKERLVGAVDCAKTFVRDIALKPLVLQKHLNVDTSCLPKLPAASSTTLPPPPPPPAATPTPTPAPTPTPTPQPTPTPTPTPTPVPSLTFSWSRPSGYAAFVDSAGTTSFCTSSSTSCSTPCVFWPLSSLIYAVHVNTSNGVVIASGGTTASGPCSTTVGAGRGSISWSWTYVALVYPTNYSNCLAAGSECKIQTINSNAGTPSATFTGLKPATLYQETVCTPNCGTGIIIFSKTDST